MDQQFSLSWKNFHGNLSNGFAGLLGSREFVDVTLAVDGELLQAHKVVLSICSPYFKKMFQLNPCQHPIVVLRDITHRAMKDLIQFMYNGEVSVRQEDLASFINTAETLEIKGLTNRHSDTESIDDNRKLPSPASTASLPQHRPEVIIEDNHDKFDEAQLELTRSQIESINRLNRLVALKRKSEEFLANNYNVNPAKDIEQVCQPEKRTKLREKLILNSHKITNTCPPIGGISVRKFNRQFRNDAIQLSPVNMFNISSRQSSITDNEVERRNSYCEVNNTSIAREETVRNAADLMDDIKTEAADAENDCAFDDSPNRNISSDCANDLSLDEPLAVLPSPQHIPTDPIIISESPSVFGLPCPWLSAECPQKDNGGPLAEHTIITIPQKEDGKKKYPQRSCRFCWRAGKRRDTRFMCLQCCVPLCKTSCFQRHQTEWPRIKATADLTI